MRMTVREIARCCLVKPKECLLAVAAATTSTTIHPRQIVTARCLLLTLAHEVRHDGVHVRVPEHGLDGLRGHQAQVVHPDAPVTAGRRVQQRGLDVQVLTVLQVVAVVLLQQQRREEA